MFALSDVGLCVSCALQNWTTLNAIRADHDRVKSLFNQIQQQHLRGVGLSEANYNIKQQLASDIVKELSIHASAEERSVYPMMQKKLDNKKKLGGTANTMNANYNTTSATSGQCAGKECTNANCEKCGTAMQDKSVHEHELVKKGLEKCQSIGVRHAEFDITMDRIIKVSHPFACRQ
jgi:hypothetical protein